MHKVKQRLSTAFVILIFVSSSFSGESPKTITAWLGTTPTLDGVINSGEYDDADMFTGVKDWQSDTKTPSQDSDDLSLTAWVKHDGTSLYFAFDVTDDVLYGMDIERWVHANNPDANDLSYQKGWSWWGDGVEIMMNSTYEWTDGESCAGDGRSWQVVCSTHKSTLFGLEQGGLMAGEPRTVSAWGHYESWTRNGDMAVAIRLKNQTEGRGYVIEWRINPNPCMQIDESTFVDLTKETKVGINFEVQDLDEQEKGTGNWSNFHHIDYWSKVGSASKTALKSFGTLVIKPSKNPTHIHIDQTAKPNSQLMGNYPNPFNPSTTIRYALERPTHVAISIFNSNGRLVRSFHNMDQPKGTHDLFWDGRDNNGHPLTSGVYFCQLKSSHFIQTHKLLLLE